jgi:K+-transporting ATPase ATPase C chain
MLTELKTALRLLAVLTLLTGVLYPLSVTALAKLAWPHKSSGDLLLDEDGRAVGARMIGQHFAEPKYFWSRPSATGPVPYNAAASSGSNLGPLNPALIEAIQARIAALKASDPDNDMPIPVDLVTASASGLDPHISPAAASWQVGRVARARGLAAAEVEALVQAHTEQRSLGVLGEPRVHVLALNMALDELQE